MSLMTPLLSGEYFGPITYRMMYPKKKGVKVKGRRRYMRGVYHRMLWYFDDGEHRWLFMEPPHIKVFLN